MKKESKIPACYWFPALGGICIGFISLALPPVSNHFMELFDVGYAGLGLFLSALFWSHALIQVPAGMLADRLGVKRSLYIAIALQIFGSLVPFLNPTSLSLAFIMRLLLGIGTGIFFLAMVKALTMLAKPHQIVRGQGIQGAAFSFGSMIPYVTLPFFGSLGWVLAYLLGAILSVVVLLALLRVPKEPLEEEPKPLDMGQILTAIKKSFTNKEILILGCFHGFSFGTINTVANWLPQILLDAVPGSDMTFWAFATGGVFLLGTLGRVGGGELGRHFRMINIVLVCTLIISAIYIAMGLVKTPYLILPLGLTMGLVCGFTYASIFTLTTKLAVPGYVATGVGVMNTLANVANVILIVILGHIREYTGEFSMGLMVAGLLSLSVCALGFSRRKDFWL